MCKAKITYGLPFILSFRVTASCGTKAPQSPAADVQVEAPETQPLAPKQLPPPGEPGPFLLQITDQFPTQVFGSAATNDYFAVAIQGDVRDETLCPQTHLLTCFRGVAYIVARMNPNTPRLVSLYESDTQSGSRVDDLASASNRFVFAINEGHYAGDSLASSLLVVDQGGTPERTIPLNSQTQTTIQTALVSGEEALSACFVVKENASQNKTSIRCEEINPVTGSRGTLMNWSFDVPVRSLDIARLHDDLLVVWNAGGHIYASFSDDAQNAVDLGEATTLRPIVAAGHEQFMIAWQDASMQTRVTRLTRSEPPKKSLALSGVSHRSLGGLVPTTSGFVLAFRYENAQQLAVIEPDLSAWNLVEGSTTWRMLSDYASLDIQEAHQGKIYWQTVDSLIGEH